MWCHTCNSCTGRRCGVYVRLLVHFQRLDSPLNGFRRDQVEWLIRQVVIDSRRLLEWLHVGTSERAGDSRSLMLTYTTPIKLQQPSETRRRVDLTPRRDANFTTSHINPTMAGSVTPQRRRREDGESFDDSPPSSKRQRTDNDDSEDDEGDDVDGSQVHKPPLPLLVPYTVLTHCSLRSARCFPTTTAAHPRAKAAHMALPPAILRSTSQDPSFVSS